MARLLIPTRNRPSSLASVIAYIERFSPGTEVIIADGSEDGFADRNRKMVQEKGGAVALDYRRYAYEMPFFDRLLDVLRGESDPFIIMGSDDDYPLLDALKRAERRLIATPNAVTALGATLKLSLRARDDVAIGMSVSRPLSSKTPLTRANIFSLRSFSTTYAVTAREHLIERYERAKRVFLPGFFDFGVGMHDALSGQVISVPEFTYLATRNFNHSYLRPSERYAFMKRQDEFGTLQGIIAGDLQRTTDLRSADADERAAYLIGRRIVEVMGGAPLQGGSIRNLREDPTVEAQVQAFFNLFSADTDTRAGMIDRVRFVVEALNSVAASDDNAGEANTVASLEAQKAKEKTGPERNPMFTSRLRSGHAERQSDTSIPTNVAIAMPELLFAPDPDAEAVQEPAQPVPDADPAKPPGTGWISRILGS